jgi:microcin C transport system ATP-binding protein
VPPADPAAPVLIEGDDVKVWFPIRSGIFRRIKGYVKAVDGVSLKVRAGSTLGVVGESGSGKTTLGLALLRLLDAEGAIRFRGRDIAHERQRRLRPLRREMQVVFQDPYSSLSPRLSIAQIVGEGLRVHNLSASEAERRQLIEETRARLEAAFSRARRADLGARHVGAGADRRSPARITGALRPRLSVHQP